MFRQFANNSATPLKQKPNKTGYNLLFPLVEDTTKQHCHYYSHTGTDIVEWFLDQMLKLKKGAVEQNKISKPLAVTQYQEHEIQKATNCWVCQERLLAPFPGTSEKWDPKVRNSVSQSQKQCFWDRRSLG